MSKSSIIYSNNDWNDVVKQYNLKEKLEIVINQKQKKASDDSSKDPKNHLLLRTVMIASVIALFGNLPVQSHLNLKPTSEEVVQLIPQNDTPPSVNSTAEPITIDSSTFSEETIVKANIEIKEYSSIAPIVTTRVVDIDATNTSPLLNEVVSTDANISEQHAFLKTSSTFTESTDINEVQKQNILTSDYSTYQIQEDVVEVFTLPARAIETYAGHNTNENNGKWKTYRVKSYDNLTNIFYKLGHQKLLKTLKKDKLINKELKKLTAGTIVRASADKNHPFELIFSNDNVNSYVLAKKDETKYSGTWKKNVFEVRQSRASFTIRNGLFFDGRKVGIENRIIKQVVKVFDWDIDFSHDIRVGDKVTAVFEEIFHDGDKIGVQNLLAAEFINKGREFRAVRYTYKDGKSDYFTPDGREMKKAFIRTPISHARVSSHFNPGRFHPILHKMRAHKGTDFAARRGTPIMATGNGTITSLGRKGGYGRAIIIKHREGYKTLYAHMSKYNTKLKTGDKVYQGDIIGYVGSSGYATGPHLHYEFLKDGKAIDPMKAKLPHSLSLSSTELQDFRNKAINLVLQLNVLNRFVKAEIEINSAFGG